jgi:hypothetical protein
VSESKLHVLRQRRPYNVLEAPGYNLGAKPDSLSMPHTHLLLLSCMHMCMLPHPLQASTS